MHDLQELYSARSLDRETEATLRQTSFIDASEILLANPSDLLKATRGRNEDSVKSLLIGLSRAVAPPISRVSDLVEDDERLCVSSGDDEIDNLLGGGFRRGVVTEIVGESAAGKSHLCLQLAITSQLPHLTCDPGGVILLTSERKPSKDRLREIAQHALPAHSSVSSHRGPRTVAELLSNVHTKHVIEVPEARKLFLESLTDEQRLEHETSEVEMLELALAHHIPSTIEALAAAGRPKIRLLLVDSIGALFRASFDNSHSGLSQRSTMLCQISDKLKVLATRYDLAVVVVNQVTDVFDRASTADAMSYAMQSRFFSGQTSDLAKEASLGLVWANSVNVRVMLSRTGRRRKLNHGDLSQKRTRLSAYDREVLLEAGQDPEADYESTLIRRMHLVFSPFAPEAMLDFVIIESGIHSLATSKTQPRHAYISEPPPELADSPEYALDDIDLHAWEAVEQEALLDVSGTAPADDMPDSDDEPNDHEAQ